MPKWHILGAYLATLLCKEIKTSNIRMINLGMMISKLKLKYGAAINMKYQKRSQYFQLLYCLKGG
jgi:hypothetical protein